MSHRKHRDPKRGLTNSRPHKQPNNTIHYIIIGCLVLLFFVCGYMVYNSTKTDSSGKTEDTNKIVDSDIKQVELNLKGLRGDEKFKLLGDTEDDVFLQETTLNNYNSTYMATIPSDTKKLRLYFLNNGTGKEIIMDDFTLDGKNIKNTLVDQEKLKEITDGKLILGGEYVFDLTKL